MRKPLRDWTLKEVQNNCTVTTGCKGCVFLKDNGTCRLFGTVNKWDLSDVPRFTAKEVEAARGLKKAFPYYDTLYRSSSSYAEIIATGYPVVTISGDTFPSIDVGETITLSSIAEAKPNSCVTPRFSEQEQADARAFQRALGFDSVKRASDGRLFLCSRKERHYGVQAQMKINGDGVFPSVRPGEDITLAEIARG
jgi:hypothetical protein